MERVRVKADQSRDKRQSIELCEENISIAGQPSPFKAFVPQDDVINYRDDKKSCVSGRLEYKVRNLQ